MKLKTKTNKQKKLCESGHKEHCHPQKKIINELYYYQMHLWISRSVNRTKLSYK